MSPSPQKRTSTRARNAQARDQYSIGGKISGHAVVAQGPGATVTVERAATPAEIEQQYREGELLELKRSTARKCAVLKEQAGLPARVIGNPYPFGRELGLQDRAMLCGRDGIVEELLQRVDAKATTLLVGSGGVGKTSLLQAGLIPALLERGHLPILVPVQNEGLELSIKRQVWEEVGNTKYLAPLPLSAFLQHVIECLPEGKSLVVLLDRFEEFFEEGRDEQQQAFKQEWALSLRNERSVRWLFSVHLGHVQEMSLFQPEISPLTERVVLPPLDRDAARESIRVAAGMAHVQVDEAIAEDILDRLGVSSIHPSQLQTVCYLLTGGSGPLVQKWNMADYARHGYADGILREALDHILSSFPVREQEAAWQILACLLEAREEDATADRLAGQLQSYGVPVRDLSALLEKLAINHLVDLQDGRLRLANSSLRPRILQWASQQAASQKIRQETARQVERIRNSAVRGLIGGAIAFALFDLLIYTGEVPDPTYLVSFALPMAAIGGIAGILLTLTVDLAITAYRGPRRRLQYLVGALGGGIAFCVGFLLYANNNYAGQSLLQVLPAAAFEGIVWGGVVGLAVTWVKNVSRNLWLNVLAGSILCGLVLLGVESLGGALANENWQVLPSWWRILLAGVLPAFLFQAAALSGHPPLKEGVA